MHQLPSKTEKLIWEKKPLHFTMLYYYIITKISFTLCPICGFYKINPFKLCMLFRCPCDECTISHMITCGIISPEVAEQMPTHNPLSVLQDSSRYIIDVTPPSMSSTSSSSGSSSPITVDPERLTLPFDDCPDNLK